MRKQGLLLVASMILAGTAQAQPGAGLDLERADMEMPRRIAQQFVVATRAAMGCTSGDPAPIHALLNDVGRDLMSLRGDARNYADGYVAGAMADVVDNAMTGMPSAAQCVDIMTQVERVRETRGTR